MHYKYAVAQDDYSDFASGRVLRSLPGYPAFPVRLASEVFQRCIAHRQEIYGVSTPCTLYDPCCGAGYLVSVLGYLHREHIRAILASDIDEKAAALAERNLSLLDREGLERRMGELSAMLAEYGKESHREALQSAERFRGKLPALGESSALQIRAFQADATNRDEISARVEGKSVDIVLTDVPHGLHSRWHGAGEVMSPLTSLLDALRDVLSSSSIVAIASDKGQKPAHERFRRVEHFQAGKRRVVILRPV